MDFARLNARQFLTSAALIVAGAVGVWLPSRFDLQVSNSDVRSASVVLGIVLISFGVAPIITRRWHVALVLLILPAALAGALAGAMIWDMKHLDQIVHGTGELVAVEFWRPPQAYCGWGAVLGAGVVPLVAALLAAWRTRAESEPTGSSVAGRLERWHSLLIVLAVVAALAGGFAGTVAWDLTYPGFYYSKFTHVEGSESWMLARHRAYWGCWGALLGASLVPLSSLMIAVYGSPDGGLADKVPARGLRRARA